ncbi:MAG: S9 family peptidase [Chlorobi bacterium]|nr:S9 family peptidase [Chlorobiota bacterium]
MKSIKLIILSISILFASTIFCQEKPKNIKLEDIWKYYKFMPKNISGMNSLSDGVHYTSIKNGSLVVYDYKSGDSATTLIYADKLIPSGTDKPIRLSSFTINKSGDKFLIPTKTESIYRHSSKSVFYVWDVKKQELDLLSTDKQRLADFSPTQDKVAFVRENNIYVKDLESGNETQITKDGKANSIINGTCDWVYEEEFGFTKGFYWSPQGNKIAFYRFDETKVKEFDLTFYGELYPREYKYKYPKAGESNSSVEIYVYNLETEETTKMDIGAETDQYIPRIKWTNDNNKLAIQRLNRRQNHLDILLADANNGKSKVIYREDNDYYIDITDDLTFLNGNKQFIISSEQNGFNHIYLYNMDGSLSKQLTSGNWDVTKVYGYDKIKKRVFYQCAKSSPLNRDIYYATLKGKNVAVATRPGTNDADFSTNYKYFIGRFSSSDHAPIISVNSSSGKLVRILEDNEEFMKMLQGYNLAEKEYFKISSPNFKLPDSSTVSLNSWRILPPDFDSTKKYPVLLTIYGGPGSQQVTNSWGYFNYFWYEMLAENGIIVISVDNRGTGGRGELFKKMTQKELGKYETLDYIEVAKYMGALPYVDKDKIAIFGWSYGGFMASNALFQGADYFNTGIAVAPVTNWRYYDNIYTERFMVKPQDNADGYDKNSPINHVKELKGNYLLIHGSADDNVHFQNSMDLITALVEADKQFDLMVYPNKNHGIYGGNTRFHLYTKMTNFLYEHLK